MMNTRMLYIKIVGWRNKSREDHDCYKYQIYAVGKRKPMLRFKAHRYFFPSLSSTLFLQYHFTFLQTRGVRVHLFEQPKFQSLYIIAILKLQVAEYSALKQIRTSSGLRVNPAFQIHAWRNMKISKGKVKHHSPGTVRHWKTSGYYENIPPCG